MNTSLNLSSANKSYINQTKNAVNITPLNKKRKMPRQTKILLQARLASCILGGLILAIQSCRKANGIGVNIIFKKGIALNADTYTKYSGKYAFRNKNDKFVFEFKDGIIQKSTKKGENGFVKKYIWKNNELSKVIKDKETIDIEAMKTKIQTMLDKINSLKENLETQKIEYDVCKNEKNNQILVKIKQLRNKIKYIETKLELNENEFDNNKLKEQQETILRRQLEKLNNIRNYYLDKLNAKANIKPAEIINLERKQKYPPATKQKEYKAAVKIA